MSETSDWSTSVVGDLLIAKNDKAKQVKSTEYASSGTYPVVDQSANFICGFHDDATKVITADLPLTVFGDHTRHTKFISFPFIAGADGTQLLKPRNDLDDKLFYYLVAFAAEKIGNYGYDRHFKHLKEFRCAFPICKPEQSKIAEVLSTVDRAIEQTEALIAKQQRIKTGLMQDLLTRGIDENGNLRSEETHEFKDTPLGRIPVEWQMRTLNDCVPGSAPICYGILMPGRGHEGGVPVIKVKDIIGGRIVQDDILLTDPRIDHLYRRSRLKAGDILLTIRGTTGRVAIVPPELDSANITQDTARVRLKEGLSKQFFYFLLQSFRLQDQIRLHTLGQAVNGINIAEVKRLSFGLPDEREQAEIASRLATVQQAIDHSEVELLKQRSLKTGLMQDLLTGKVRVMPLLEKSTRGGDGLRTDVGPEGM